MDPFEMQQLGQTGVQVTRLGFGGAQLGGLHRTLDEQEAEQTLEAVYNAGILYYDTSPFYGHGRSEHRVGHYLRQQPRDSFVLSTKVGRLYKSAHLPPVHFKQRSQIWTDGLPFVFEFDYTYDGVMRSHEDSLQRLGVDRVEVLLIHDLDVDLYDGEDGIAGAMDQLDSGGGLKALMQLRDSGAIKAIGAGINREEMIKQFLDRFDLDVFLLAMPYSLIEQNALDEILPMCAERKVCIIKGAPYASGVLATGAVSHAHYNYAPATPEVLEKVRRIEQVCHRHEAQLRSVALQFPFGHECIVSTIPGVMSPQEVNDNVQMMSAEIPQDLWSELKAEGLLRSDAPTP